MVAEAKKFKVASRVAARNNLESFTYELRNKLSRLTTKEKTKLESIINETIDWLDRSR